VVKQKRRAVMIKIQYSGEKSVESSIKSVSNGRTVAPTSPAVDSPLNTSTINLKIVNCTLFILENFIEIKITELEYNIHKFQRGYGRILHTHPGSAPE
jgi:hypothetical protein